MSVVTTMTRAGWYTDATFTPSQAYDAVRLTVGEHGPCIRGKQSQITVNGSVVSGGDLSGITGTSQSPIYAKIAHTDMLASAPRMTVVKLYLHLRQGYTWRSQQVGTYDLRPQQVNGMAGALMVADGTYWAIYQLSHAGEIEVTTDDGTSYRFAVTAGDSVQFIPKSTGYGYPVSAKLVGAEVLDTEILASVQVRRTNNVGSTSLSAWPLPPYLNAKAPKLGALLDSFEYVLDVRPDQANAFLDPTTSTGVPLTEMGKLYGVSRFDAPTDSDVALRILNALYAAKNSIQGLKAMLISNRVYGAEVLDLWEITGGDALFFDGKYRFDGTVNFDGGAGGWDITLGQVLLVFESPPFLGFEHAAQVARRHVSAGIHVRVMLRKQFLAELPNAGFRIE